MRFLGVSRSGDENTFPFINGIRAEDALTGGIRQPLLSKICHVILIQINHAALRHRRLTVLLTSLARQFYVLNTGRVSGIVDAV
jgi:hypothetical protein